MDDADYENLSAFSCGVGPLDDFFNHEVQECVRRHYLAAYCAYNNDGELVAAFTFMNDALMIAGETEKNDFIEDLKLEANSDIVDFFNKQSSYPAINIGHLGTRTCCQRRGTGTAIIDLVADTYQRFKQAGCQFITVDALNNPLTTGFYRKSGFFFQTNKDFYSATRRMYRIL